MTSLIFAFRGTIAERCLRDIETDAEKLYIGSTEAAVDQLVQRVTEGAYDYVIGLGSYSGRDSSAIHIEQQCTSQFRNRKDNLEVLPIPYFFTPSPHMKLSSHIGNSWCNLVSYKLLKKVPDLSYTFFHVPKNFEPQKVVEILDNEFFELI